MDSDTIQSLGDRTLTEAGLVAPWRREALRVWTLSGVERVHLADGSTVFLKYARGPFTREARVLADIARQGVPVPKLLASVADHGLAALVLEDLGEPVRDPTLRDAALAAVIVHRARPPDGLTVVDTATLPTLVASCRKSVRELADAKRWADTDIEVEHLERLADVAPSRAQGADVLPFGLCHGEFNPTSLHIGLHGWRLVDWASVFRGPGLLDLAGWQYTTQSPDLAAFDALLDAYVEAGGPATARAERGGLPPAQWAFGWHRVHMVDWYLQQATTWIADPASDSKYQQVIRRHLSEAIACLDPN